MGTRKAAVIGFYVGNEVLSLRSPEKILAYLSDKTDVFGRILFTLGDYLTKYSKKFDILHLHLTDGVNKIYRNGSLTGIIGLVNRSEIDIGVLPVIMNEVSTEVVDFSYPYPLLTTTFVTKKAEYKPQIFGILQTFSLPLWISIISILIAMSLLYYVTLKKRYSFDKIFLQFFSVLLRQSSILKPSSIMENLLVFSWVVGAIFLCLAYDSVFLSFLSFPPISDVEDVSQLAKAVKEGRYHSIVVRGSPTLGLLLKSKEENLRIIGRDIEMNNLSDGNAFKDFLNNRIKQDLALLIDASVVDILAVGKKFVSEDRFLESMGAMPIRKGFCCKKLLEKIIHRLMASGLYFKYQNDRAFLFRMPRLLKYEEIDTSKRKLTITDVAPAFIFLICGHTISFLVFIVEILSNRMKINKKRRMRRMRIA